MTTVAYKNGVIAGDTQITGNGTRMGFATKIGRRNGILYGASGSLSIAQDFLAWVAGGMVGEPPSMSGPFDGYGNGMVAWGPHVVTFNRCGIDVIRAPYFAIGSGWELALGAMAAGKSAEQAIKIAMLHDTHTGGKVMSLRADGK